MRSDQPREWTAADVVVLNGEEAVRKRVNMYYGVGQDSPSLPEQILRHVVQGTMWVPPASEALEVAVTIEDDLVFSVRDNGSGMSPKPRHPTRRPDPEMMLTEIHGGHYDRDGQIGVAAALCSRVTLRTSWDGVEYETEMDRDRNVRPLTEFGPSLVSGTEIRLCLDAAYLAPGSMLPVPSQILRTQLFECRKRSQDRLTILDRRPSVLT